MRAFLCCSIVAAVGLMTNPALAQNTTEDAKTFLENKAKDMSLFEFEYGGPESPVLPLVGVAGDQITKVESFRRLGLSLLEGQDSDEPSAVALDFSPYFLLGSRDMSLADYRDMDAFARAAVRSKGAIAVSEGKSASAPSTVLISLSSKLLSLQDPLNVEAGTRMSAFEQCLVGGGNTPFMTRYNQADTAGNQAAAAVPASQRAQAKQAAFDAEMAKLKSELDAEYDSCQQKAERLRARRPSLDAGVGVRFNGTPGKLNHLKESGTIAWATFGTGVMGGEGSTFKVLDQETQFVLHARYTFAEAAFDDKGIRKGTADSGLLALSFENVPPEADRDRFRWSFQGGWNHQDSVDATVPTKDYWRYLGVVQFKVVDKVWAKATFGRVEGRGVADDTYFLVGANFTPDGIAGLIDKVVSAGR